jgi:glycosyltransferase 2 family protein
VSGTAARVLAISARLAVTLGAAWLVFSNIDWTILLGLIARVDPLRLALAGVVLSVQFAIMVRRWRIVIEFLGDGNVATAPLALALGRGMLIGQPLPSTVGGDVVRTVLLSRHTGMAIATRAVVCDRITSVAMLAGLVVVTLPLFGWRVGIGPTFLTLSIISLGALAVFVTVLARPGWFTAVPWIGSYAATLGNDAKGILVNRERGASVLLLALAIHLLGVLLIHQLAHALGSAISLVDCLLIVPATLFISAVPISLGGWGVRDGALAAGFVMMGLSSEEGVATSVLFGLTGPLIGLLAELATPLVRMRVAAPSDRA